MIDQQNKQTQKFHETNQIHDPDQLNVRVRDQTHIEWENSTEPVAEKVQPQKSEISEETINKIRSLSPEVFESTFMEHLRLERRLSMVIIYFMKEAYRRRAWSQNYPTFTKYCVERLKMSESEFYRKFSIMRTLEDLPEVESKIMTGEIQPATVAKMSQFFYRESKNTGQPISIEQKREVFKQMEGLSLRQVERELAILSPESAIPDKTRQITEKTFIRQFTSSEELETKINRAKELLAHALPQPSSDCQLFTKVMDITLDRIDPILREERNRAKRATQEKSATQTGPGSAPSTANASALNRKIPEETRRFVLMRDGYACTHLNHDTGEKCGSRWALEIDHIRPFAQGGDHSPENLRVLCRTHNQLHALETYGRKKMSQSIETLS